MEARFGVDEAKLSETSVPEKINVSGLSAFPMFVIDGVSALTGVERFIQHLRKMPQRE